MLQSYCINKLVLPWKQEIIHACLLPDGNRERRHAELILSLLNFAEMQPQIPAIDGNSEQNRGAEVAPSLV